MSTYVFSHTRKERFCVEANTAEEAQIILENADDLEVYRTHLGETLADIQPPFEYEYTVNK